MKKIRFRDLNAKQLDKLGDLSFDLAKYIATAVLIASFFNKEVELGPGVFITLVLAVVGLVRLGVILNRKPKKR